MPGSEGILSSMEAPLYYLSLYQLPLLKGSVYSGDTSPGFKGVP